MNGRHGSILVLFVALVLLAVVAFCSPARPQECEFGAFGCGHQENHQQYQERPPSPTFHIFCFSPTGSKS